MKKFLPLLSLFALLAISQAVSHYELESLWEAWKTQHKKSYDSNEEMFRFAVFSHNYKKIIKFNEENDTPKLAINHFADLTANEFKAQHATGGFFDSGSKAQEIEDVDVEALPVSVDWRNKGAVTAVKNQGNCGDCVAFTVTGLLEGLYFINHGKLLSFSEQQIVDCDTNEYGCNGGFPYLAVEYAAKYGLETEADYPYTGAQGSCQYNETLAVHVASNYSYVTPNSTNQLKSAVVKGPVSVLLDAAQDVFQFYSSGVIKTGCGADVDFSALVVGYHKVGPLEAFIVKSSWGTSWGEDGYVQIWSNSAQNNGQGVCGILSQPLIAVK